MIREPPRSKQSRSSAASDVYKRQTLDRMWILRKNIADMTALEAMNSLHDLMRRTKDNEEFLLSMNG